MSASLSWLAFVVDERTPAQGKPKPVSRQSPLPVPFGLLRLARTLQCPLDINRRAPCFRASVTSARIPPARIPPARAFPSRTRARSPSRFAIRQITSGLSRSSLADSRSTWPTGETGDRESGTATRLSVDSRSFVLSHWLLHLRVSSRRTVIRLA